MKVHFLGTGSASSKYRNNSSLLLETPTKNYLIDCSGGIIQNIHKAGCNIENTNDLIITHSHIDHIFAIPSFLHYKWLSGAKEVRIYALDLVIELIKSMVSLHKLELKSNPLLIKYIPIKDLETISKRVLSIDNYELFAFKTTHGVEKSFGLKIFNKQKENIIFTSDAIADENIKKMLDDQTKYLIHDCGAGEKNSSDHGGGLEINALVKGTGIMKVYLHHFNDLSKSDLSKIQNIVQNDFYGEVIVSSDFLQFTFDG